MNPSATLAMPPELGPWSGTGLSPSAVNSYRISAVVERLALHLVPGNRSDSFEFYNLCLSLARGIDYALANGETPGKVNELAMLMKQVCKRKNDEISQAAMMVLMISVKNACKIGWFQTKVSEELLTIADEIGKIYCSQGNVNAGPSSCHSTIQTIMERFYPKMKLGPILVSIEAKPGYGASAVDFHITKSKVLQDKIWLLVAQTDNIETSACLISPQQVNFLLNGKGVDPRTNVRMDPGPQMPTNVTGILKFGTNLLQAVGQFNGHYIIVVAYMSVTSLPERPVLQDYVQSAVTSVDSDSDIIEGPSRISLNCPISFTRIKTPVKGHSCKHFRCFDFDNFININVKRPSWRCPHCNQYVCYADIRLDRNMIEILKNVGKNIVEVIVHADGSWKAVLENDHDVDKIQNKACNPEKEQTDQQETICSPSTVPDVLDLTDDDNHLEMMDTWETADRKPLQASVLSQFVTPNSTSLGMNSTGFNQNVSAQIEDEFWAGVFLASSRSDTPTVGVTEHPVPPDTVSPAFNQGAESHDNNPAMHNQFSALNKLQMQLNYNSVVNEYGRSSSMPRHINRTPVAVQALPVQSQALGPQQNSVTNLDSFLTSSSSATPHVSLSNPASSDPFNAILSDTERQQHFSRSPLNLPQVSGVNSSPLTLQHQSATQNRVPPVNMSAPTQSQNPYRASGMFSDFRNPHLQQALNLRPSNTQRSHIQQGVSRPGIVQAAGASANSQQARVMPSSQVTRQGEQRGSLGGAVQSVSRPDELFNSTPDQNWRPTSRMRGSLAGRVFSDDIRQRIIAPTQPVPNSSLRPQGSQPVQSSRPQGPPQPVPSSSSRPQGSQPVQSSRPQGPQPIPSSSSRPQGPQPVPSSRPHGPQPVPGSRPQGPQPVPSSRPQGPQPVPGSRPQGPQPVRPTSVSPQLDVLVANNRNAHKQSPST